MATRTNSGVPQIIGDDNTGQLTFLFNGDTFAISITQDPASWFETIKDAHRNGRSITITDDSSVTRNTFQGAGCYLPTDLHNS
jgi:hypothetical protein